jgi:FtsH-binding integral membrane protein
MPGLGRYEVAERTFFHRVFGWMGGGLLLTALVAWYFGTPERFASIFGAGRGVFFVLVIAQLGLVFAINSAIRRLSEGWAASLFVVYSALMGLTLSSIFLVYTTGSIASAFFASGGTFAAAGIYGAVTKKDLTSFGGFLFMALIGLVIATVVNLFVHSSGLTLVLSYVGVFVFIGLTAFDVQKLKAWHQNGVEGGGADRALAIGGALTLYLDFINLFIYMLRIMGDRRRE